MAFKLLRIDVACPAGICLGQGCCVISAGACRLGSKMQTVFQRIKRRVQRVHHCPVAEFGATDILHSGEPSLERTGHRQPA